MRDLTLTEIWIYPIKSLGGIRLSSARVMEKGLEFDRRWMLVDENGIFMTQREHNTMALLKQSIEGKMLTITRIDPKQSNKPSISFDAATAPIGKPFAGKIFDDTVLVAEVDPRLSEWFTLQLETNCRLVSFRETDTRPVDVNFQVNHENVSLADAYPFLIIGQSTLDELNSRLSEKLPMNRFRPNFVFTGGEPAEEDRWRNFTIGSNRFVGVKPCGRCAIPTINQDTGVKGIEPTYTLSTYRRKENKVLFGQNLVAVDHTVVNVGDSIKLESLTDKI
jgi:uncharacterized protein